MENNTELKKEVNKKEQPSEPKKVHIPQTKTFVGFFFNKKLNDQKINQWMKETVLKGEALAPFPPQVSINFFGIVVYVFLYSKQMPVT